MNFKELIFVMAKAIEHKNLIVVHFKRKGTESIVVRKCAPLDYGLSKRTKCKCFKFHFWDFGKNGFPHPLSLESEQIFNIEISEETFKPEEFITWNVKQNPWMILRDWGEYS